jgi:hypothetical protein
MLSGFAEVRLSSFDKTRFIKIYPAADAAASIMSINNYLVLYSSLSMIALNISLHTDTGSTVGEAVNWGFFSRV